MYKLLIVEDEEILCNVLPLIIEWEKIGFEIVGTASNGMLALKFLEEKYVDVVLTDIRMPIIDGLELACEVKVKYPHIKTILLSAYSDFEYARKAIEYGVYAYLLKSDDEDIMREFFIKLKSDIDKGNVYDDCGDDEISDEYDIDILCEGIPLYNLEKFAKPIITLLNLADSQKIIQYYDNLKEYLYHKNLLKRQDAIALFNKILYYIKEEEERKRACSTTVILRIEEIIKIISELDNIDDMFEKMKEFSIGILSLMLEVDKKHIRKIVENAVEFINANYMEDIRLNDVARHVCVHPVHLSRLFSNELNKTFKAVLTDVRIETAKKYLLDINMKIYEISSAVGYKKPRYFSELFKKETGLTPIEFREKYVQ